MGVVYHYRQLICRHVIASPDDEVSEIVSRSPIVGSKVKVGQSDLLVIGDSEAPIHSRWFLKRSRVGAGATASGIERLVISFIRRGRRHGDVFARACARINCPQVAQLAPSRQVKRSPLALRVRSIRATAVVAFVPADAEPTQILEHRIHKLRLAALGIEILVAEH